MTHRFDSCVAFGPKINDGLEVDGWVELGGWAIVIRKLFATKRATIGIPQGASVLHVPCPCLFALASSFVCMCAGHAAIP